MVHCYVLFCLTFDEHFVKQLLISVLFPGQGHHQLAAVAHVAEAEKGNAGLVAVSAGGLDHVTGAEGSRKLEKKIVK